MQIARLLDCKPYPELHRCNSPPSTPPPNSNPTTPLPTGNPDYFSDGENDVGRGPGRNCNGAILISAAKTDQVARSRMPDGVPGYIPKNQLIVDRSWVLRSASFGNGRAIELGFVGAVEVMTFFRPPAAPRPLCRSGRLARRLQITFRGEQWCHRTRSGEFAVFR